MGLADRLGPIWPAFPLFQRRINPFRQRRQARQNIARGLEQRLLRDACGQMIDRLDIGDLIALIFGQAGLIVGATLEGTRYARILP